MGDKIRIPIDIVECGCYRQKGEEDDPDWIISELSFNAIFDKLNAMSEGEMAVYATSTDTHDLTMIDLELGRRVADYTFIKGWDGEYY